MAELCLEWMCRHPACFTCLGVGLPAGPGANPGAHEPQVFSLAVPSAFEALPPDACTAPTLAAAIQVCVQGHFLSKAASHTTSTLPRP